MTALHTTDSNHPINQTKTKNRSAQHLSHLALFVDNLAGAVHQLLQSRETVFKTLHFLHALIVDGRQQRRYLSAQRLTEITVVLRQTDRLTATLTDRQRHTQTDI